MRRNWTVSALLVTAALGPVVVVPVCFADPAVADPRPKGAASSSAKASASSSGSASASGPASASAAASGSSSGVPVPLTLAAEVMVLYASNTGGGIDPRIGDLPQLKKPPFSAYDTYKLLSQSHVPLASNKPVEAPLPNDRVLRVTLKEAPAPNRFKITTSITKPKGTTFLRLLEVTTSLNEPFFVAGQHYKEGMMVVGIKLVK